MTITCERNEGLASIKVSDESSRIAEEGVERFVSALGGGWASNMDRRGGDNNDCAICTSTRTEAGESCLCCNGRTASIGVDGEDVVDPGIQSNGACELYCVSTTCIGNDLEGSVNHGLGKALYS